MKTLNLVRHATSRVNAGEYWDDGPATIPLSDFGLIQADEFAANWSLPPDLIVVSSYARSIQTASPLARKFGVPLTTMDVREFTFWDFRFTQREFEVDRKLEGAAYWSRLDPLETKGGHNAESFVEFLNRCKAFRSWAEVTAFDHCVCVSHGFFMHAFRALMAGVDLPDKEFMAYLHKALPAAAYANLQVEEYSFQSCVGQK